MRIISILIIEILLIFLGSLLLINRGHIISYFGLILLILSISIPDLYDVPTLDLRGYFNEMNIINQYNSIHYLLLGYSNNVTINGHESSIIYNIFQWYISKTGYFTLLPFLVVLISYFCISYPAVYQIKNYRMDLYSKIFIFFASITLFPYWEVSNTVRWMLASAIFFIITYFICISNQNKRWIIFLLYIPLIFIHEAIFIPIVIVAYCLIVKRIKWYHYVSVIIACLVSLVFIRYYTTTSVYSFLGDAHSYSGISGGKHISEFTGSITSKIAAFAILVVPFIYSIGNMYIKRQNPTSYYSLENKLFDIFNIVDLMLLPDILICQRYALYVGMIDIIFYLKSLRCHYKINSYAKLVYSIAFTLALFAFIFVTFKDMTFNFSKIIDYVGVYFN